MINNIEYGIYFTKNILNPTDNLYEETEAFTRELIFEKSEAVFIRKPQYKKKFLGLTKSFQNSSILFDVSDDFFNGKKYEVKYLKEFDYEEFADVEKVYDEKPEREAVMLNKPILKKEPKKPSKKDSKEFGYCIRTGEQITFNPERPFSYPAFKSWNIHKNYEYKEKYCHKTGRESIGKTSMNHPILNT